MPVFDGDLTPDDETKLEPGRPYAVLLGLPDTVRGVMLSGEQNIRTTVDVVLEHRGVGGNRPHRKTLVTLRHQVVRAAAEVTELAPGVLLSPKLRYLGGAEPSAKYQEPTVLTATCRFQGGWRMTL